MFFRIRCYIAAFRKKVTTMKRYFYLTLLSMLGWLNPAMAQIGTFGSDLFGYKWTNNLNTANPASYNWIDISTNGIPLSGMGDDNIIGPISLGIDFKYYWNTYNSCYVGSNGYIMFDDNGLLAQGATGMPNIPVATDGKGNFIAPFLADLTFVSNATGANLKGSKVMYATQGSKFIITYDSVRFWNNAPAGGAAQATGLNTFQIVLDATDNSIQINYKSCVGPFFTGNANYVTQGMENITGSLGMRFRRNSLPPANSAVKVVYPASSTFAFNDIQARALFTFDNKGGVAFTGIPKTLKAFVQNAGTVKVKTPITTRIIVFDNQDNAIYNQTLVVDSLLSGEQKILDFPVSLQPGDTAASFKVLLRTTSTGDQYAANNETITKLVVLDSTQGSVDLKFTKANPGNVGNGGQGPNAGMVFDPPYSPMVVTQISADMVWPDIAGWELLGRPGVGDSLTNTRIEVYLGDGPGGSIGSLIDSFTISSPGALDHDTVGFEEVSGTLANHILRFKRTLPFPYLWDTDKRIYVGAIHENNTRFVWNAPYSEVYQPGFPASGRSLEITGGVWGQNRGKDSIDVALGLIGDPVLPAQFNFSVSNNILCAGETLSVPFTTTGTFFNANNIFNLQLSSATGSFANPTIIGSLPGTAVGTINAQLPVNLPNGDGYRLRIVSTSPVYPGSTGNTVIYCGSPKLPVISGNSRFCPNDSNIVFQAVGIGNASRYNWILPTDAVQLSGDTSNTIAVKFGANSGVISVSAQNRCGLGPVKSQNLFVNSATFTNVGPVCTAQALSAASYQWLFNGSPIGGATGQTYTITQTGEYCVEVTFATGCKIKSACQVLTSNLDVVTSDDFLNIWPNPASSTIHIGLAENGSEVKDFEIRNSIGQFVSKGDVLVKNQSKEINVSNWSNGIYFIRVQLADGKLVQKSISIQN